MTDFGSSNGNTLEQRLAAAEALAADRGIDISTDLAAIERRIKAMDRRLHPRAYVTRDE